MRDTIASHMNAVSADPMTADPSELRKAFVTLTKAAVAGWAAKTLVSWMTSSWGRQGSYSGGYRPRPLDEDDIYD